MQGLSTEKTHGGEEAVRWGTLIYNNEFQLARASQRVVFLNTNTRIHNKRIQWNHKWKTTVWYLEHWRVITIVLNGVSPFLYNCILPRDQDLESPLMYTYTLIPCPLIQSLQFFLLFKTYLQSQLIINCLLSILLLAPNSPRKSFGIMKFSSGINIKPKSYNSIFTKPTFVYIYSQLCLNRAERE